MLSVFSADDRNYLLEMRLLEKAHRRFSSLHLDSVRDVLLGGHRSVRESLLRGLQQLGGDFDFNMRRSYELGSRVGVLAGRKIARQLIERGHQITLGPSYSVSPIEDEDIFSHDSVSKVLVPSEWVGRFYSKQLPSIATKLAVWPAGVDTGFWMPAEKKGPQKIALIYAKGQSAETIQSAQDTVAAAGWDYRTITYGSYTPSDYRSLLDQANFLVWLGSSESQGLAQFEAWSMGVPTFVYRSRKPLKIPLGRNLGSVDLEQEEWSPSPYLSVRTGRLWETWGELKSHCVEMKSQVPVFAPREYVEDSFSDRLSARAYRDLVLFG